MNDDLIKVNIYVSMQGLYMSGKTRHPQIEIKEMGITYDDCEPMAICDCWFFYGVDKRQLPNPLPDYMGITDRLTDA